MTLPQLSIRRHVLAWMMSAVLVLFGLIAYDRIGMDRYPYIEFPVVSVRTALKGANPDVVDKSVTSVIESTVNSVPGIDHIQSTSSPGISIITLTFNLEKKIDVAFNEVQAKVNQVLRQLPKDADPPVVAKVETNAQPILWFAVQGDRTQQQLNQYALNVVKKQLEMVDGVGEVRLGGRRDRTIRIYLDPARMAAHGVGANEVSDAFAREHLQLPGGFLIGKTTEHLIKLDLEFHRVDELRRLIVAQRGGYAIKLGDIATIEDGQADFRQTARFNGEPTVGVGIVKVTGANTVKIVERALAKMDKDIRPNLPPGMRITTVSNDAVFILEIVQSLKEHLIEGTLLAALVVWFFLRSVRSTLIISLAIPVSLMGAIAVIYFFDYTLNSLTLLALLLLIGVVVDDSIVVLENIYRHREEIDDNPITAAVNGSTEVAFAVFAASLSLVSIFAPVIFMSGIMGQFFRSFAVVVTFGVLVSLFVSLTLTPMLCSRYLTVAHQHGRMYHLFDKLFTGMDNAYRRLLDRCLHHRWKVVFATLLAVASSAFFFQNTGKTFAPEQDEGRFLVNLRTPLGSSIEYTDSKLREVETILDRYNEALVSEFAIIGGGAAGQVNQGTVVIRMKPRRERKLSQQAVIAALRKELGQIAGARAFAAPYPMVQGQRGEPLQFVLSGENIEEIGRLGRELQQKLSADPGIGRVDTDLQLDLPQMIFRPDRERIAAAGLSTGEVAFAVNLLAGGVDIAKYNDEPGDGQRYDIRIKAGEGNFRQPSDLNKIWLRSRDGKLVRMDSVARFEEKLGPAVIARFDLQYAATFYATPTIPLGEAVERLQKQAAELPTGYSIKLIGQAEEFGKTQKNMIFVFGLAMLLLYMVLASQFNSFLQPAIVMLAQPLAIIGGVAALWAFGQTINIYSMIGLVLLVGLVAKNSILLVDLTNQRREQGMAVDDALNNACPTRMRPVLMTSATVILALFPAALGLGAGAETNQPLAIAVIGGMISSTLLTLVVVPAVYSLVENRTFARGRRLTH